MAHFYLFQLPHPIRDKTQTIWLGRNYNFMTFMLLNGKVNLTIKRATFVAKTNTWKIYSIDNYRAKNDNGHLFMSFNKLFEWRKTLSSCCFMHKWFKWLEGQQFSSHDIIHRQCRAKVYLFHSLEHANCAKS